MSGLNGTQGAKECTPSSRWPLCDRSECRRPLRLGNFVYFGTVTEATRVGSFPRSAELKHVPFATSQNKAMDRTYPRGDGTRRLELAGLPDPRRRYTLQLSGG